MAGLVKSCQLQDQEKLSAFYPNQSFLAYTSTSKPAGSHHPTVLATAIMNAAHIAERNTWVSGSPERVNVQNLGQSRTGESFHLFLVRNWEKVSVAGALNYADKCLSSTHAM